MITARAVIGSSVWHAHEIVHMARAVAGKGIWRVCCNVRSKMWPQVFMSGVHVGLTSAVLSCPALCLIAACFSVLRPFEGSVPACIMLQSTPGRWFSSRSRLVWDSWLL